MKEMRFKDEAGANCFIRVPDDFIVDVPKTELGRKLLKHREKAIIKGLELKSADEINA